MKKLLTVLFICVLTICCTFAFTACGENKPSDNPNNGSTENNQTEKDKFAVTADEWRTAFDNIANRKASFAFSSEIESDMGMKFGFKFDKQTEAYHFIMTMSDETQEEQYLWKDGDEYNVVSGEYVDKQTAEDFNKDIKYSVNWYGAFPGELVDKFSQFTYNKEKSEYTAASVLTTDVFELNANQYGKYTVKFENGKVVKITVSFEYDEDVTSVTANYTYDVTVTVPDNIKNLAK